MIREQALFTSADMLLALGTTGEPLPPWAALPVSEVVIDSRRVIPGALFVALRGENLDGHDFVADAFARGALFALVERAPALSAGLAAPMIDLRPGSSGVDWVGVEPPLCLRVEDALAALQQMAHYWRRQLPQLGVIAITGSVGKSTTKEVVAKVLEQRFVTLKNPGNYNNEIGLPLTLLQAGSQDERAVLEMGFYQPGEIAALCKIAAPRIGIVSNVGTVHAARAGSQAEIARGKAELVQALPPAPEGLAILNYDDPWVRPMAAQTRAGVLFYGLDWKADLWADAIETRGLNGVAFNAHYGADVWPVHMPLLGDHAVLTALRAIAVGLAEGLSRQEIQAGLDESDRSLRLSPLRTRSGTIILDDSYNATPESTLSALALLSTLPGHRIAILGDMLELGPYEQAGHEQVGRRVAETVDELVTVGPRARTIAASAVKAGLPASAVTSLDDVEEIFPSLGKLIKSGNVLLVKGSHGMRMDRLVKKIEESE